MIANNCAMEGATLERKVQCKTFYVHWSRNLSHLDLLLRLVQFLDEELGGKGGLYPIERLNSTVITERIVYIQRYPRTYSI